MSRRRSNLPPNFGFQRVSAFHAPSAKRHVRSRACVPPMVSTPPSHPSALWNTLLSGSSITTGFQPFSVLRTMVSFAGPGTEVGLPSAPVPSTNCAWATRIAGYGPPVSGSRRGVDTAALAGGALAGVFSPPPPQAWSASRTASSAERGIGASSPVGARLSTNRTIDPNDARSGWPVTGAVATRCRRRGSPSSEPSTDVPPPRGKSVDAIHAPCDTDAVRLQATISCAMCSSDAGVHSCSKESCAVAFVVWDSVTNTPTSWVQQLAWILVTIYTGPIGAFVYLLACRSPGRGLHDVFTRARWKQGVNSEMHCLAGDATGIVIAAAIVPAFALPNGIDLVIEYIAAFVVGLFVFQALMMVGMYDGNYLLAVRKTVFAETVSMNTVMVGMIPAMVVLMSRIPTSRSPRTPEFWFVMGMAAIAGGITAYPINWWLVKNRLKHGCMTLPERDGPAPELGHRSMEPTASEAMPTDHHMEMRELPAGPAAAWMAATFLLMLGAAWLATFAAPISFRRAALQSGTYSTGSMIGSSSSGSASSSSNSSMWGRYVSGGRGESPSRSETTRRWLTPRALSRSRRARQTSTTWSASVSTQSVSRLVATSSGRRAPSRARSARHRTRSFGSRKVRSPCTGCMLTTLTFSSPRR